MCIYLVWCTYLLFSKSKLIDYTYKNLLILYSALNQLKKIRAVNAFEFKKFRQLRVCIKSWDLAKSYIKKVLVLFSAVIGG